MRKLERFIIESNGFVRDNTRRLVKKDLFILEQANPTIEIHNVLLALCKWTGSGQNKMYLSYEDQDLLSNNFELFSHKFVKEEFFASKNINIQTSNKRLKFNGKIIHKILILFSSNYYIVEFSSTNKIYQIFKHFLKHQFLLLYDAAQLTYNTAKGIYIEFPDGWKISQLLVKITLIHRLPNELRPYVLSNHIPSHGQYSKILQAGEKGLQRQSNKRRKEYSKIWFESMVKHKIQQKIVKENLTLSLQQKQRMLSDQLQGLIFLNECHKKQVKTNCLFVKVRPEPELANLRIQIQRINSEFSQENDSQVEFKLIQSKEELIDEQSRKMKQDKKEFGDKSKESKDTLMA